MELSFSSKLYQGSCIVSVANASAKKIGALIFSVNFLHPEVALYLYKSSTHSLVWNTVVMSWLVLLAGIWICQISYRNMYLGLMVRNLLPFLIPWLIVEMCNQLIVEMCKSFRYFFGRCSSELVELVPLAYFRWRSTYYSNRLHNFSVTIPRCFKDVYVNNFFPRTFRLWNSLPAECFPLNSDLNGFKSRSVGQDAGFSVQGFQVQN